MFLPTVWHDPGGNVVTAVSRAGPSDQERHVCLVASSMPKSPANENVQSAASPKRSMYTRWIVVLANGVLQTVVERASDDRQVKIEREECALVWLDNLGPGASLG